MITPDQVGITTMAMMIADAADADDGDDDDMKMITIDLRRRPLVSM